MGTGSEMGCHLVLSGAFHRDTQGRPQATQVVKVEAAEELLAELRYLASQSQAQSQQHRIGLCAYPFLHSRPAAHALTNLRVDVINADTFLYLK